VELEILVRALERRMIGKQCLLPEHPVEPLAGLPVRDALDARAEDGADRLEHGARIRQRHASDKINIPGHCRAP
jgi:hypothetical protein